MSRYERLKRKLIRLEEKKFKVDGEINSIELEMSFIKSMEDDKNNWEEF